MHMLDRRLIAAAVLALAACSSKTPAPAPDAAAGASASADASTADASTSTSTSTSADASTSTSPSADAGTSTGTTAGAADATGAPVEPTPTDGPAALAGAPADLCDPSGATPTPIDGWALPRLPSRLTLFPDGLSALAFYEAGYARVDLATGAVAWRLADTDATEQVSVAPSGDFIWYSSSGNDLVRVDAKTGLVDWRAHGPSAMAIIAVDDDTVVYDDDGAVVLDVGARVTARKVGDGDARVAVGALALAPGGKSVVAFDANTVRWIDPVKATITKTKALPEDSPFAGAGLPLPDGSGLAAVVEGKLTVVGLPGLGKRLEVALPEELASSAVVAVSRDGKVALLASSVGRGSLHRVDLAAKTVAPQALDVGDVLANVTVDRTWVVADKRGVTGYDAGGAQVATAAGQPVALVRSGDHLVVVRSGAVASLSTTDPWTWRAPAGQVITSAVAAAGGAVALELDDGSDKAASVSLDAKTGAALATAAGPAGPLVATLRNPTTVVVRALGADGQLGPEVVLPAIAAGPVWIVVAAGKDRVAAASNEELAVWTRDAAGAWGPARRWHYVAGALLSLSFAPDDARLAIEDTTRTAVVDLASNQLVASVLVPDGSLAWSPDGQALVSDSGVVETWPLDPKARPARPAWVEPWFHPMTFEGSLAGVQAQADPDTGAITKTKLASEGKCALDADQALECKGFTAGDYEPRVPTGMVRETRDTLSIGDLELPRDLHGEMKVELSEYDGEMVVSKAWSMSVDDTRICVSITEGVVHEGGDELCLAKSGGFVTWHQAEGSAAVMSDFTITFKPPQPK